MKVIKRDGTTCDFDRKKISVAIGKANAAVDPEDQISAEQIDAIVDDIASRPSGTSTVIFTDLTFMPLNSANARNHSQSSGFTAAGRPYQSDEIVLIHFEVEIVNRLNVVLINFVYMFE